LPAYEARYTKVPFITVDWMFFEIFDQEIVV